MIPFFKILPEFVKASGRLNLHLHLTTKRYTLPCLQHPASAQQTGPMSTSLQSFSHQSPLTPFG